MQDFVHQPYNRSFKITALHTHTHTHHSNPFCKENNLVAEYPSPKKVNLLIYGRVI